MSICGPNINLESKRNEFFLSVIALELKYPRRRSFHQIYFPLQKSSAKKMARHGNELTTEQKEMLLSLSHQGFSSYKIQEFTGINCITIQKFLKRTRQRGSIKNNPRSGGRKKLPQGMKRSVKRNRRQTLKELPARFNNRTEYNVSERTVRRRLCVCGYKRRINMQENYNITCKSWP